MLSRQETEGVEGTPVPSGAVMGPVDPALEEAMAHFDMFDQDYEDRKWTLFDYAREHCPVAHTDGRDLEFFVLTAYEDIRAVVEDWRTWSSTEESPINPGISLCPIDVDPPKQTAVRKLLNPLFSKSALAPYEDPMRATARRLIDNWIESPSVDIMNEYAGPYIGEMLTKIVFNNMTKSELVHAQAVVLRIAEQPTQEAFVELTSICKTYLEGAIRDRTETPDSGLVSTLLSNSVDASVLSDDDRMGILSITLLGGLDTSRAAIGSIVRRLAEDRSLEDRLRDPVWVKRDLDELLRLDAPVGGVARVATCDTEIRGVKIRRGQRVQIRFDAANRDPSKFRDPHSLVFDEPRTGHGSFGFGVHRCVGSNMARLQIEIAFDELLKRVTNFRLLPDQELHCVAGPSNALHPFRVAFDRV